MNSVTQLTAWEGSGIGNPDITIHSWMVAHIITGVVGIIFYSNLKNFNNQ